jgi:hypothetical protein
MVWRRGNSGGVVVIRREVMKQYRQSFAVMAVMGVILSAKYAAAGGLGIPLDGFLTTLLTFVTGLGLLMFTAGAASWGFVGPVGQ